MKTIMLALFALQLSVSQAQTTPVDCKKSPMFIFDDLADMSRLYNLTIDSLAGVALLEALPEISGTSINGIGYRLQDKMVYGCESDRLIRIDGTGAKETLATLSQGSFAGDVTPDGHYLVLGSFKELSLIDLESGSYPEKRLPLVFPIGQTTLTTLDLAFNPVSGILYAFDINTSKLVTVDINSGVIDYSRPPTHRFYRRICCLIFRQLW